MAGLKLKKFSMEQTSNMAEHRTDYYNSSNLIVRRGQGFKLTLDLNRSLQKGDKLEFIAETGPAPQESDDTLAIFSTSDSGSSWSVLLDSTSSTQVNAVITSPADAVIGHYKMKLQVSSHKKAANFKLHDFILLFNPWAPDDVVYMEDENEREEYVLNDSGIMYYGHEEYISKQGWNFGQFEEGILDICLRILDKSLFYQNDPVLDSSNRFDPGYVGRVCSSMINSFDDEGVLEGRWKGRFTGGVDPENWIGSVEILKKWHRGGYKPVKYGQCWVFAGVLCTVLRCLGIPTRAVTNFASAHDKDGNLSVDSIYSNSGRNMSKDTLWNYHVWNESWFKRNDLDSVYEGWQVLDATPQELSEGIYCLGPASVHAVKEGDVHLDYDMPFVFSEVNADRSTWIVYDKDVREKVYTDDRFVGKNISTKAVGSNERIEITDNYKYPEGSAEERAVYLKARKKLQEMGIINGKDLGKRVIGKKSNRGRGSADDDTEEPAKLDITGKFKLIEPPKFDQDVKLMLILQNSSNKNQSLTVKLSSSTIEYTGIPTTEVFSDEKSLTLGAKEEKQLSVTLPVEDFEEELTKDALLEVSALCEIKKGKKMLVRKVISLEKPPIEIKVVGEPIVDVPFEVQITFSNPLTEWLKDGMLVIVGSGLVKEQLKRKIPKMEPKDTRTIRMEITPYRSGTKQLVVDFISTKFPAIKGFQHVEVLDGIMEID
ncbi:protein-glutamine gamma-glutamyltransferase 6-like [Discoglossus pictus]